MTTTTYKRFNIQANQANPDHVMMNPDHAMMKTVDDYENEYKKTQSPTQVDAARIALSNMSAFKMLPPIPAYQRADLTHTALIGSVEYALAPNRIELRHFTMSSRVRNLVHGGITGLLAARLTNPLLRSSHSSRSYKPMCGVIRRVNGEAGCEHVKWSIPEFQFRFNIGVKLFKNGYNHNQSLTQLNLLDTAENREAFMKKCKAVANAPNQSRVKYVAVADADESKLWKCHRATVLDNDWITQFINAFSKVCLEKMAAVRDPTLSTVSRAMHLVDMYHFVSSKIDWILTDPNMRHITNMDAFWEKYMERITYMATEGIEHSALLLAKYFPEMMTPELHVVVNPVPDLYRVPQMQIDDDDVLFGPLKAAYQALLPEAPDRSDIYEESDYDDYDYDDNDISDYDDSDYDDSDYDEDNVQG